MKILSLSSSYFERKIDKFVIVLYPLICYHIVFIFISHASHWASLVTFIERRVQSLIISGFGAISNGNIAANLLTIY